MSDQWYYSKVEPRVGPFTAEQLKELAAAGKIRPQDTVWKAGVEAGVPAAKVKHLFADLPETVPPAATPPPAPVYSDPNDMELAPGEPPAWSAALPNGDVEGESEKPRPRAPEPKKKRVIGVKGGVIISQDGQMVKFRKKCQRCSYADTNVATMPIRSGVTRVNFFCPKCKKSEQVEVQAVG